MAAATGQVVVDIGLDGPDGRIGHPEPASRDDDLAALVRRDRAVVLSVALGYLGNPDEAEDVAQEVFVKAYGQLAAGVPVANLTRSWMLTVTAHGAIDRRRSAWWRHVTGREPSATLPSRDPSLEDQVVAADERGSVLAAVQQLPPRLRDVVSLYYLGDASVAEVANMLHIKEGAVKARLFRARDRLRPLLLAAGLVPDPPGPASPGPSTPSEGGDPRA